MFAIRNYKGVDMLYKFRYKVKENYCSISPRCQAWAARPGPVPGQMLPI